ncbi:beta transducin [Fusarium agapanthi]|uniref:Beta transducin n=1 Tax=Fusarium agapanthi TaxID=1803897 RepID=A0A9P5B456_9HYPO|nr:beta transducin [Fusarium agapanthi]
MRLVNAQTIQLEFLTDDNVPDYAFLSHTWEQKEVLFHNMGRDSAKSKKGYAKLESCCRVAREKLRMGLSISGTIPAVSTRRAVQNSVKRSIRCIGTIRRLAFVIRWFTRGWTLQELIAPSSMISFDKDWRMLGTKTSLVQVLSQRTSIPKSILCDSEELETTSISHRMSWAADRVTRKEDSAYYLMGIFGINMPLLYSEGYKAFYRLQEEIMRVPDDHSLFAWKDITSRGGLLAPTPAAFKYSDDIIPWNPFTPYNSPFTITNKGVHMEAPFIAQDTSVRGLCVLHFVDRNTLPSLPEAASAGDAGSVWYLLAQNPSGTMQNEARSTVCLAARGGHERLVSQLLADETQHISSSTMKAELRSPTLQSAAKKLSSESSCPAPESTLTQEMYMDLQHYGLVSGNVGGDGETQTALWHAVAVGGLDLVELLLQNKALQSVGGEPVICAAVSHQYPAMTDLLLQYGADSNERDTKRRSPLHIACRKDNHEIVALLLRHGVNADTLDTGGKTQLAFPTLRGNVALVKVLLENGANPRAKCVRMGRRRRLMRRGRR